MAENMGSLAELNELLAGQGKSLAELPGRTGVQQGRSAGRNARNRPRRLVGTSRSTAVRASAINGEGVFDALRAISKQVAASL